MSRVSQDPPVIKAHDITLYGGNERAIVLRPLSDAHLPLLEKWNAAPEVLYWTEGGVDIPRSYDARIVRQIYGGVSQHALCFLVEVDGVPIGECWLQVMNLPAVSAMYPGLDVRRIDMAIGEKACWGQGIGTQFVRMLVDWAFAAEHVDVLHCLAEDYNLRSQKVWLKLGYHLVRSDPLPQPQKGRRQLHFALTREEYVQSRRPLVPKEQVISLSPYQACSRASSTSARASCAWPRSGSTRSRSQAWTPSPSSGSRSAIW